MMCCNTSIDMIQIVFRYMLLRVRENERPKRKDSEDKNDVNLLDVFNLIFVFCFFFSHFILLKLLRIDDSMYGKINQNIIFLVHTHTHSSSLVTTHYTLLAHTQQQQSILLRQSSGWFSVLAYP